MTVYDDERVTCVSERVSAETGRAGARVGQYPLGESVEGRPLCSPRRTGVAHLARG